MPCYPLYCSLSVPDSAYLLCYQVRQDFFDLLSDQHVEGGQRWSKVKEKLETDPRYKAVDSSALREELYKQYMEKQAKVEALGGVVLYLV